MANTDSEVSSCTSRLACCPAGWSFVSRLRLPCGEQIYSPAINPSLPNVRCLPVGHCERLGDARAAVDVAARLSRL